jgi:hypothetical protein
VQSTVGTRALGQTTEGLALGTTSAVSCARISMLDEAIVDVPLGH